MSTKRTLRLLIVGPANSIHIQRWAKTLSGLGVEITLFSESPLSTEIDKVRTVLLPGQRLPRVLRYLLGMLYAPVLMRVCRTDLVHIHSLGTNALLGLTVPNRRLIVTPWGSDIRVLRPGSLRARLVRRVVRRASLVLTTSQQMRFDIIDLFGRSGEEVQVISWGVDTDLFHPAESEIERKAERRAWGLPEEGTVLLSNRTTSETYRTADLVRAFVDAAEERRDLHLVVLGGFVPANARARESQSRYISAIRETALSRQGQITFIDRLLSPQEMASLLRASDAVIAIPQADQRSTSVLEAMATGVKVVLSDIAPYRELKDEGGCVDLIEDPLQINLLRHLASIEPLSSAHREQNVEFIAKFETWSKQASKVLDEYRHIARQR